MRLAQETWSVSSYTVADDSGHTAGRVTGLPDTAARRVLENLGELEPELRGAAIFDLDEAGSPAALRASIPDDPAWGEAAAELLRAVGQTATRPAADAAIDSGHIALADGEVFIVREAGQALVASTGRFVLASLTGYDMRMALRDLAASEGKK